MAVGGQQGRRLGTSSTGDSESTPLSLNDGDVNVEERKESNTAHATCQNGQHHYFYGDVGLWSQAGPEDPSPGSSLASVSGLTWGESHGAGYFSSFPQL